MLLALNSYLSTTLAEAAHETHVAGGDNVLIRGYLIAWLFWLGIGLGSVALLWLHNLTGGKWGRAIRLELAAGAQILPLVAIGVIPLLMHLPDLFIWARPDVVAQDHLLQKKAGWLNPTFFVIRTIAYFAIWSTLMVWITRLRRRAIADPSFETEHSLRFLSAQGLVAYGITMTLAAVDYGMSLEPHWYSGIYGLIFLISQALSALAFTTSVASTRNPEQDPAPFVCRDLGNLLFAFTMLWTYMSLSQFLIIWMGDLPEENVWYLNRSNGGWTWLALTLICLGFCAPFFTLMSNSVKNNRRVVGIVAFGVLTMRWFDLVWHVEPAFSKFNAENVTKHAVVTVVAGVVWFVVFAWRRNALKANFPAAPPAMMEGH